MRKSDVTRKLNAINNNHAATLEAAEAAHAQHGELMPLRIRGKSTPHSSALHHQKAIAKMRELFADPDCGDEFRTCVSGMFDGKLPLVGNKNAYAITGIGGALFTMITGKPVRNDSGRIDTRVQNYLRVMVALLNSDLGSSISWERLQSDATPENATKLIASNYVQNTLRGLVRDGVASGSTRAGFRVDVNHPFVRFARELVAAA